MQERSDSLANDVMIIYEQDARRTSCRRSIRILPDAAFIDHRWRLGITPAVRSIGLPHDPFD
jgi:hypothetical protein